MEIIFRVGQIAGLISLIWLIAKELWRFIKK
jgi:hypothetical protein